MTDRPRYAVVGCSDCGEHWLLDRHQEEAVSTCPRCEATYLVSSLRARAEAPEYEVAAELRARILADRAGHADQYAEEPDWGVARDEIETTIGDQSEFLAERAEESLGRYDDWFGEEAEQYLQQQEEKFSELVEARRDRWTEFFAHSADPFHTCRSEATESSSDDEDALQLHENARSDHIHLTDQEQIAADVTIGPGACTSPRDIQDVIWNADRSDLTSALIEAIDDLVGDLERQDRVDALVDEGVTALKTTIPGASDNFQYAQLAAYAIDTDFERDRLLDITRQLGSGTSININSSLQDVVAGPIEILATTTSKAPSLSVDVSGIRDLKTNQQRAVLDYLLGLTPGVDIRLTGSELTQKVLILEFEELFPVSVTERAKSRLQRTQSARTRTEELRQQARDLLDEDADHIDWRRLESIRQAPGERRSYDDLQNDSLCDFDTRDAVKQFARRMREKDLLVPEGSRQNRHVRLTPLAVTLLDLHLTLGPEAARGGSHGGSGFTDVQQPSTGTDSLPDQATVSDPPKTDHSTVYSPPARDGGDGPDHTDSTANRQMAPPQHDEGSAAEGGAATGSPVGSDPHGRGSASARNRMTADDQPAETDGERPDEEAATATAGGGDDAANRNLATRFLDHPENYGVTSVADDAEIVLMNRENVAADDSRTVGFSFDADRMEATIEVEDSSVKALTMVRFCSGLVSEKALEQVLTVNRLAGGKDRSGLGGLPIENPYVLRNGGCLGYLRNVDTTARKYRKRLRAARNELLDAAEAVRNEDGEVNKEAASDVLQAAHGLAGTVTRLYDMIGISLCRKLRVPEFATEDDDRREHIAKMIGKQTAISSRYGVYSAQRVLYEPREEKREQLLGAPDVDPADASGDVIGSWVLVGPDVDSLERHLADLDDYQLLQEDGENFAPFRLDLSVRDGNDRAAFASVATRFCSFKNIKTTRKAISILQILAGDPITAATALNRLHPEDDSRKIDLFEVRYGFSEAIAAGEIDAENIVPDIGSRVVSSVVASLLEANDDLSKSELADVADVTTEGMSYDANEKAFVVLEAAGLLDREDLGVGKATKWRIRVPYRSERRDSSAPNPWGSIEETGFDGTENTVNGQIFEAMARLVDEIGTDIELDLAGDLAMEAFGGPPDRRDLRPLLDALPALRPLVDLVCTLLGLEDQVAIGNGDRERPPKPTIQFGKEPSPETTQVGLEAAATTAD